MTDRPTQSARHWQLLARNNLLARMNAGDEFTARFDVPLDHGVHVNLTVVLHGDGTWSWEEADR